MRKIHFATLLALFLTLSTLYAEEFLTLKGIIGQSGSATAEKYPDADDVLLNDYIQVRYEPDGTSETWDDTAIKILTEKGKRKNRTLKLAFNVSYGTNYFTRVQVIKPDGSVQDIDPEANSRIMVNPDQMKAGMSPGQSARNRY